MSPDCSAKDSRLVTVLLPTFNRRSSLGRAIASVLSQTYSNLELVIIRDGGCEVADIVGSFDDRRITFLDRAENRGKCASLNEGIRASGGYYICCLDDDDFYYPHHIRTLVEALAANPSYRAAYSDLYRTNVRVKADGSQTILSKVVEVSRDFYRPLLLQNNHILHVSMIHERSLLDETGLYNPLVRVMIDWDMARRISFYTDFLHVPVITGEFIAPVDDCDRISIQQRKDPRKYLDGILTIRTTRPPKPWPKVADTAIVPLPAMIDQRVVSMLQHITANTFFPYRVYLPVMQSQLAGFNCDLPAIETVAVDPDITVAKLFDDVLQRCDADFFVPLVGPWSSCELLWLEKSLYAAMNNCDSNIVYALEGLQKDTWAAVFSRKQFANVTASLGKTSLGNALTENGLTVRGPDISEKPFTFDHLITLVNEAVKKADYAEALEYCQILDGNFDSKLMVWPIWADVLYRAGNYPQALEVLNQLHRYRRTPDTLLLEAKILKHNGSYEQAANVLLAAEKILNEGLSYV